MNGAIEPNGSRYYDIIENAITCLMIKCKLRELECVGHKEFGSPKFYIECVLSQIDSSLATQNKEQSLK